jgi:hypothetical protein
VYLEREMLTEAFRLARELDIDPAVVLAADRDGPVSPP